jgi:Arc-like DNA binding domain
LAVERFRFLLRMPLELRERLVDSASRAERSLNAEIVHRLEAEEVRTARPSFARVRHAHRMESREGRGMKTKRLRLGVAALAALVLVAMAVVLGGAQGPSSSGQVVSAEIEGPPTLTARLAQLKQALPPNGGMSLEGPGGAAGSEFAERAYPDTTISVAEMEGARDAFAAASSRAKGNNGGGKWQSIGPSRAVYPRSDFLTSFLYVPNTYIAGGRTTSIAIEDECSKNDCEAYITPAGGGVWHTYNLLKKNVKWNYRGGPLGINAAGAVTIDPHDRSDDTVYVGTGEANICGSGCVAGTGLYRTTNHGHTWTQLGKTEFQGKGIGKIVVHPNDRNILYVATTTALGGMSSVCCTGVTRPIPGIAKWGLYKSTDRGASWSFIHNGSASTAQCFGDLLEFNNDATRPCSPRGVRNVLLDPSNPNILYATSYARGVWRSNDAGATWTQIKASLNPAVIQTRATIAVNTLPNGNTRMYVYEGNAGQNYSRLFRSDSVATGVPVFTDLTDPTPGPNADPAHPGFAWRSNCDPQCWYDQFVYTPKGFPDIVYVGGDYSYGEVIANKRGVVLSTDAGVTGTDMTFDGTDPLHPNGLHPDQHDLVTVPGKPFLFIETNDGGVMRSNGRFVDRSSWCNDPAVPRGLSGAALARCQQMLSRIPERLEGLNDRLNTLQFQSLSISPHDSSIRQGGTQDNGTWQTEGSRRTWENKMIGDGGQSGFDVAIPEFRFHTFTTAQIDVNFNNGNIADWIWIGDPVAHGGEFYAPVISDPVVSKTMFAGTSRTAYRTQTAGLGTMTVAEANNRCNEWTGIGGVQCGDWAELGADRNHWLTYGPNVTCYGTLPAPQVCPPPYPYGTDRTGGNVAAIERAAGDTGTAWAATTTGRVFVTKNVDAPGVDEFPPPSGTNVRRVAKNVVWSRIDLPTTPGRFVSSIHVDSANPNRAWISYSGYSVNTPATPGHVFEVTFNPATGTATWVNRSNDLADLPVTDLVRDDVTGDLYAASDFGVLRLPAGSSSWELAAGGMPNVEVAGLTIVKDKRQLYAATHGLSAWLLNLRTVN